MNKKEKFILSLKGWKYKGTLNNIYHNSQYKLGYNGDIEGSLLRTCIPQAMVDSVKREDGHTILFLVDSTYYILGTMSPLEDHNKYADK